MGTGKQSHKGKLSGVEHSAKLGPRSEQGSVALVLGVVLSQATLFGAIVDENYPLGLLAP